MAEVSRQEFADLCGDDVKTLNVYISRNKVIVTDPKDKSKAIDTTHPINKAFLKQRKESNKLKQETKQIISSLPHAAVHPRQHILPKGEYEDGAEPLPDGITPEAMMALFAGNKGGRRGKGDEDDELGGMRKWMMMKIKGDAELVALRVEKEQLLLDKAAGKLVPVDVAADVLRSQAKTIFVNFENSIENIANVFCTIMAGGNMDMYTRIVENARKELHTAINRAGAEANTDLDNILNTYADSRANKL